MDFATIQFIGNVLSTLVALLILGLVLRILNKLDPQLKKHAEPTPPEPSVSTPTSTCIFSPTFSGERQAFMDRVQAAKDHLQGRS